MICKYCSCPGLTRGSTGYNQLTQSIKSCASFTSFVNFCSFVITFFQLFTFSNSPDDGCATLEEWIPRWTQFYGFSENHARAFFNGVNDGDVCVTRDDVVRNFQGQPGVPATFFPNLLLQVSGWVRE